MYISRTTPAAASGVLSTADLKEFLRVEHALDDSLIDAIRDAAVRWVEDYLSTFLGDAPAIAYLDAFTSGNFPIFPIQSITEVKYYDVDGVLQVLSTDNYYFDLIRAPARIVFTNPPAIESERLSAVIIVTFAGYLEADIPGPVLHAVKLVAAHFYENRAEEQRNVSHRLKLGVDSLLSQYRLF
jgi:uncharacterized phiE125 gp8 family phage protein